MIKHLDQILQNLHRSHKSKAMENSKEKVHKDKKKKPKNLPIKAFVDQNKKIKTQRKTQKNNKNKENQNSINKKMKT